MKVYARVGAALVPGAAFFVSGFPLGSGKDTHGVGGVRADEVRLHEDAPCTRMLHAHVVAARTRMRHARGCKRMYHAQGCTIRST